MLQGDKILDNAIRGLKAGSSSLKEPYERARKTAYKDELGREIWGNYDLSKDQKNSAIGQVLSDIQAKSKPKFIGPPEKPTVFETVSNKAKKLLPPSTQDLYKKIITLADKHTKKGQLDSNAFYIELAKDKKAKKVFDKLRKEKTRGLIEKNKTNNWGINRVNEYTTPELYDLATQKRKWEWDKKHPKNPNKGTRTGSEKSFSFSGYNNNLKDMKQEVSDKLFEPVNGVKTHITKYRSKGQLALHLIEGDIHKLEKANNTMYASNDRQGIIQAKKNAIKLNQLKGFQSSAESNLPEVYFANGQTLFDDINKAVELGFFSKASATGKDVLKDYYENLSGKTINKKDPLRNLKVVSYLANNISRMKPGTDMYKNTTYYLLKNGIIKQDANANANTVTYSIANPILTSYNTLKDLSTSTGYGKTGDKKIDEKINEFFQKKYKEAFNIYMKYLYKISGKS